MTLTAADSNGDGDGQHTLSILIATDNHLGYLERDPIRGQDSFHAFSEIMQLARTRNVDMVLLGGDLFHDNKPSRKCLHQALTIFKQRCLGSGAVALEYLSDPSVDFASSTAGCVNYEDPDLNVCLPVFTIHGNHDDPSGDGNLSAVDVLAACGLVNYFGRQAEVERVRVSPVLLRKGDTRLALYGLGNIRDERLHRTMARNHVTMCQATEDHGRWFNLMVLHQNRAAHGPKNHIPEHFLSEMLDFVVWGHEHQCLVDAEYNHQRAFYVSQPGSSVATALSSGEASPKHVAVLRVNRRNFKLDKIRLKNVRPFVIEDVVLAAVPTLSPQSTEDEIVEFLRRRVERMLVVAQQQYQQQIEEAEECVEPALGAQPKPLIRLRVEYSGGFESFHPQRFGLLFADRVANPRDIIYFFRKPRTLPLTATTNSSACGNTQGSVASSSAAAAVMVPAPVDAVHVESLIAEFLDDSSMRMLVDLELAEAVRLFVQKGDADAIAQSLKSTIADTKRRVLSESLSSSLSSSVALVEIGDEKQLESRIGLTRAARRLHAVENGHGLVDAIRTDSAVVVSVPVVASGGGGGGGGVRRAAINVTDRNAIREFERIASSSSSAVAIQVSMVDQGGDDDGYDSSNGGEGSGNDDFRQDLLAPSKSTAVRGKRVVAAKSKPPAATGSMPSTLGKRSRAKQPSITAAMRLSLSSSRRTKAVSSDHSASSSSENDDGSDGGRRHLSAVDEDEDDAFMPATTSASSKLQITRPSRNARTTLAMAASASTASPAASVQVTDDDVVVDEIIDDDDDSLPSSMVSMMPPAKRGRSTVTRARKAVAATTATASASAAAGGRGRGRGRGSRGRGKSTAPTATTMQHSGTLPSSQMPAVSIDDDDDDDDDVRAASSRGFGGFSLRKRT